MVIGTLLERVVPGMRFSRFLALYRRHFSRDPRRERMFLASLSFFLSFGFTRVLTHSFRLRDDPFTGLWVAGTHVHHLVWGILLLLLVGYGWLVQVGTGMDETSRRSGRFMAAPPGRGR